MVWEFSVGTWNCFGQAQGALDAITAGPAPHGARLLHRELRQILDRPHVVCIQEVLSREAEVFFDGLGVERVRDLNHTRFRPLVTMRGSGLGIAGQVPLGPYLPQIFERPGAGWDRLARKGTMHVRLAVNGLEIDLINLHLQAGCDGQAVAIRTGQIAELMRRVAILGSDKRMFLVCGDFNVCGLGARSAEYSLLRHALAGFEDLGQSEDLPTWDPHPERNPLAHFQSPNEPCQRLDYIFMRPPRSGPRVSVRQVARILDRPLDGAGGKPMYASDHFGLLATLEIGPP
jgi:endonuclease/exonuclease/phosphatase family metal-dependent hydrolase